MKEKNGGYKKEKVISFDANLNTEIQNASLKIAKFYEYIHKDVQIKGIVCKFIIGKSSDIYFIGCKKIFTIHKVQVDSGQLRWWN